MEKLSISNFAGLKDVSFEVRPVTGFIGPQAAGKSIIAKLLYFFREIAVRLPGAVLDGRSAEYKAECWKRFSRYFPVDDTRDADFRITYSAGSESVRVVSTHDPDAREDTFNLEWSDFYSSAIEKFSKRTQKLMAAFWEADKDKDALREAQRTLRQEYYDEASRVLGPWSTYEQIFVPAGRALLSQLQSSVFTNLESGGVLDPFMAAFGSLVEQNISILETRGFFGLPRTRGLFGNPKRLSVGETKMLESLRSAFKEILRAKLIRVAKQNFLQFDDGRRVKLAQASSGHQEALPLLLLLARFLTLRHVRGRAVYIEEPEAHLFPDAQKQIVELMARTFRAKAGEMRLVITTHSPYILTSINNLLQAGTLYSTANPATKRKLERTISESSCFRPGEVAFFALEDGRAKSILDPETGLIDATAIDQVSNDIAAEFDELLAEVNEKP